MASAPAHVPQPSQAAGTTPGAAAGCVQPCPAPTKPCAAQGMLQQTQVDSFAKDMAKLKKDWAKLTPDQRRARMQAAVDKAAKAGGFPPPKVTPDKKLPANNGVMRFSTWDVAVSNSDVSKKAISDQEFAELSDTLYHETRHAEQWYLIARRDAAEGKKAKDIVNDRGIKASIAKEAVKQPLPKGDPRRACADAVYESVYGKGRDDRNKTLKALDPNRKALDAAIKKNAASKAAFEKLYSNPKATEAQKNAALAKWQADYLALQAARAKNDAGYAAYRALPEEADAWDAGEAANKAVKKELTAPPPPPPAPAKP